MTPAAWSLVALAVTMVVSCTSRINVGVLALVLAGLIGTVAAGWRFDQVAAGFPSSLFLTLVGVSLLFALAEVNGTLARAARRALGLAKGDARAVPAVLFVGAGLLSSAGPGAVSTVALLAPVGMAMAAASRVPAILAALMITNGANAGNLSPTSAVGVIANSRMLEAGIGAHHFKVWFANFAAHTLAALLAYALFGRGRADLAAGHAPHTPGAPGRAAWLTALTLIAWIAAVVGFGAPVGLAAFAAATVLILAGAGDETAAMRRVPWGVIVMVSGVSTLIAVLEKTGGLDLFTALLARLATPTSVNGTMAFVTGLVSTWSSTSGVVLPAFLPTVPGLVSRVGGGDPLAVALSVNVGASMVDVSPLSTLGALTVATVADPAAARVLFRQLLIWGVSMAVVGAVLCQLFAGLVARM